ncbi:MFS transporter [Solirubrobacter sp. CPCC 204708]|uniref:MFS transporter n=1 Tax=Solirubrobacter deserti TaxID=2282478 RepID=A0ABT4RKB0_9ACTN|nr:MFS transporter [Solirubrobacter deserti]MBE2316791.1 MFS transporter [Solirubrobacter deserti]MDA0138994.1 MFS transporter [Solirubrobacter deserti]
MPPHTDPHHSRRWLILGVIAIAQLMVVLDATIVNIALPSAQQDLGFSNDSRQWVVTAYALAFGSLLLLGGRIGDLFGRKWTFIGGLLGFSVASAVGGAADSFGLLVGARAAQGVFGAMLAPSALALLATTFTDPRERGKAFGIFGAIAGTGAAIGLLLGGILTEYLSWRWALYVNLLFALPAAVLAFRLITNQANPQRPRIDVPGTLLATSGLFALVYGFSNSETNSWGHPVTIIMLVAAVILLAGFFAVERRVAHPLLPLRVIADRTRGGAFAGIGIAGIAMFALFLFLTYYLQSTLGFSPIQTGLAFLPMSAAIIVTANVVSQRLLAKFGPRPHMVTGMLLGAAAMLVLTQLGTDSSYVTHVLPALVLMGVGMGNIFPPAFQSATYGVDRADTGVASAMVNTMQQVGGSIGTALLSSIFAGAVTSYANGHTPSPSLAETATVHGYTVAFWVAAGVFAAGAIIVGAIVPSVRVAEPGAAGEPVAAH